MINETLSAQQRSELLDKIPVKKFCTPEEIAHTVDYLISPLAGFVTVRYSSLCFCRLPHLLYVQRVPALCTITLSASFPLSHNDKRAVLVHRVKSLTRTVVSKWTSFASGH